MANLFPTGYETETVMPEELESDKPIGYRNGISFDDRAGDFRRDGMNKILTSNGVESWRSWCVNCIQTERYKHMAYNSDFGIELDKVFAAKTRDEAESILTRQITEALLADPYQRTEYIDKIEYDWTAPDAVVANATVYGIAGVTLDIIAYITKGGV